MTVTLRVTQSGASFPAFGTAVFLLNGPEMLLLSCSSSCSFLTVPSFLPLPLAVVYSGVHRGPVQSMQIISAVKAPLSALLRRANVRNHKWKKKIKTKPRRSDY